MIREISGDDKVKRDKHAQVIIDEADRLAALVGDVLDLSKLQAGIEKEEFSVFNLSEDVYAVTNRFDFYVETEGYTINTDIDDDLYSFAARGRGPKRSARRLSKACKASSSFVESSSR